MSFSFEKFVQKSTRGLFAFIVVIMIVPLVMWGYMGNAGEEREEDKAPAGVIYGTITVSKGELFAIVYMAPQLAFFARHKARVEHMAAAVRLTD